MRAIIKELSSEALYHGLKIGQTVMVKELYKEGPQKIVRVYNPSPSVWETTIMLASYVELVIIDKPEYFNEI